jgi:hypothetical protein
LDYTPHNLARGCVFTNYCVFPNLAKAAAANSYRPALLICNIIYLLLWLKKNGRNNWSVWDFWGTVCLWSLQWYAYVGIIQTTQNKASTTKTGSGALVGGSSLDLLAFTCIIQLGSVLWSRKIYWLFLLVPPWAAWNVYSTFYRGGGPLQRRRT